MHGTMSLKNLPTSCAHCLEIWEPQTPGTPGILGACPGLQWDCFFKCRQFKNPLQSSETHSVFLCNTKNTKTHQLLRTSNLVNCCQVRHPTLCWLIHENSMLVSYAKIPSKHSPGPWWKRNVDTGEISWAAEQASPGVNIVRLWGGRGRAVPWQLQMVNGVQAIGTTPSDTTAAILYNNYFCTLRRRVLITLVGIRSSIPRRLRAPVNSLSNL